ncbi:hypothetical protein N7457_008619 [Penicillium paradoxum]|uniref:uncharacterized protein n=1 Tax=Penicillium paradoxum TaxID=176176 RepID=UPI0025491E4F|nr:uncharacterized protein N7457_008619 [Penicillium paradoxum]KAJ5773723.1 hypothetical protein N7457_008619 [Penicillium paradoxum]
MPADSPATGQKRPPRSAGRRRLDGPGEAILSEDRRSQIRRAQRTYRLKKEGILQQAQKQVMFLEQKMQKIARSLADYRVTLQASLQGTHCELLRDFDSILRLLTSTSEDFVEGSNLDSCSSKEISKNCTPDSIRNTQCDDSSTSNVTTDSQAIAEPSSTCMDKPPETEVSPVQEAVERGVDRSRLVIPENGELDCDLPMVQVADRFGGADILYTYSFLETSFTRRLKRTSLEHAFRIFSDPRSHPLEVFRIFRLVPCFKDKEKMYPYFKDLVTSERGASLEISALPFYCIGGAGTHYITKDEHGDPIYPPKMRFPRRILGNLPMSGAPGDPDSVLQYQSNLELCGFGGQWFDCRDVEGYLRERGVDLDGSALFPIVHDLSPSPCPSGLQSISWGSSQIIEYQTGKLIRSSHSLLKLRLDSWFTDIKISESPPQPLNCVFDLESFLMVGLLRYRRKAKIEAPYGPGKKQLSEMTVKEAHEILTQLQELEFPSALAKARKIALLKAGGIPTMSKLFAVTGQNNKRNSGKRAVDTEILLREVQSKPRDSDRYMSAVARMNYLHARYRRANKITDNDLLHTLGDGLAEIFNFVDREEWRPLTDVEKCAVGIFHKNLGEDMEIPFDVLPSSKDGWRDGLHFAIELQEWTIRYEEEVAKPTAASDQYVRVYVDSAMASLPDFIRTSVRKMLGDSLDDVMRTSLGLEAPGPIFAFVLASIRETRKVYLRYLALPRSESNAVKLVQDKANPNSKLYNFQRKTLQPWYMEPTFWSQWGLGALLVRALGGKVPGARGDRYHPQGYDLMTIGPDPQKEHGAEEMLSGIEVIKARGATTCPFSQAKAR